VQAPDNGPVPRENVRTVTLATARGDDPGRTSWLVVEPGVGRVRIPEGRVLVGRSPECDLVLDDPFVSDRHFAIGGEGGAVVLHDLSSRNGTHVNGLRVGSTRVAPGVWIDAGQTRLRCVEEPGAPAPARLLGTSRALREVVERLARYAPLEGPVLVRGETGTGKELVARALHEGSLRRRGPFVAVNCAGFSPELVDSELFGHERGAFTGAVERRRGAFELAQRGTLFLDELGELPTQQQAKLLRVLESRELRRVGGEETARLDVRIVTATNSDLEEQVHRGLFRADLFHRLAVLEIRLPPLRARIDDLPLLAAAFLEELAAELGPRRLSAAALERARRHDWPGNVRELKNALYRAAALSSGTWIDVSHLELLMRPDAPPSLSTRPRHERLARVREAVEEAGGNLSMAARTLGEPRSTVRGWWAQAQRTRR
jgi:DNA-binding NtrC family response regulator